MQEHSFLPDVIEEKGAFWDKVTKISKENSADNILIYMHEMLESAKKSQKPVHRNEIKKYGHDIRLFDGVDSWFKRVNSLGKKRGFTVEHYIISSGVREMIEATSIFKYFKAVFASSFLYMDLSPWEV